MSKRDRKDPVLKMVSEAEQVEEPARLEREPDAGKAVPGRGSGALDRVDKSQPVHILEPNRSAAIRTKSYEPEVADILETVEETVDHEASWGGEMKKALPVGWFVLAGVLVCILALWATVTVFRAQSELEELEEEKQGLAADSAKENREVKQTLAAMQDAVRGYLMATTLEEKLRYVRHRERVRPLMERYYRENEIEPVKFRHFERIRSMGIESLSFVFGQVELLDGGDYGVLLEQMEDGTFLVDWESDVCYLPVDWDEFVMGRHRQPLVMRVYIRRDNFYAYEFREESKYDCFLLRAKGKESHVFGFVEKGSKVAKDVDRYMKRVERFRAREGEPVMLKLRFPESGHAKKCVWIEEMVAPRWTYVKSPEGE